MRGKEEDEGRKKDRKTKESRGGEVVLLLVRGCLQNEGALVRGEQAKIEGFDHRLQSALSPHTLQVFKSSKTSTWLLLLLLLQLETSHFQCQRVVVGEADTGREGENCPRRTLFAGSQAASQQQTNNIQIAFFNVRKRWCC